LIFGPENHQVWQTAAWESFLVLVKGFAMPPVSTSDFKNGITLDLPEGLMQITEFQHVKPGKGGAFVRTTLKNIRNGKVIDRTYNAGEKMEQAIIDKREMQFLYRDAGTYIFMDNQTFDQIELAADSLGDAVNYLKEQDNAMINSYGDEVVGIDLPAAVELVITECEPGIQGDRVSGAKKPATLETGLVIQVPLFVNQGEKIKVDTRTGEYLTRVS
jgi:elongation factor P